MKVEDIKKKGEFISTREAALLLGVSLRTIQLWVESGIIKAWKTAGGHRRIPRLDIEELLEQQRQRIDMHQESRSRKLKILVVEDEAELQELYELEIESWELGCKVLLAKDGYEGLLLMGQHNPDLVISDLIMPDMDGFRMIRSIKNSKDLRSTQIVAVTNLNSEMINKKGGLPEDVLVLNKPIPFDVIRGLVMSKMVSQVKK